MESLTLVILAIAWGACGTIGMSIDAAIGQIYGVEAMPDYDMNRLIAGIVANAMLAIVLGPAYIAVVLGYHVRERKRVKGGKS